MCDQALFQIFLGRAWGQGYMCLMVSGLARLSPLYIIVNTNQRGRPGNEATLSPDTCHASWSPLHSPSEEGRGQGELRW